MRVWHAAWSWLKEIVSADSVAGKTLTGILTRLTLRNPFQVGRGGIRGILSVQRVQGFIGFSGSCPIVHWVRRVLGPDVRTDREVDIDQLLGSIWRYAGVPHVKI